MYGGWYKWATQCRPMSEVLWLGLVVTECSLWSPVVEILPLQVKRSEEVFLLAYVVVQL